MKIGILIGRFPPDIVGGAELQAKQVAEQLAKHGHHVVVFTRRYQQRPYVEKVDGYTICRRDELPVGGLRMVWDTFPALGQILRYRPRLDVLLCYQTMNSGLIGVLAQSLTRIPMVLSVRGNKEYRLQLSKLQEFVVPPIYKRAKWVIVQSARIQDDMQAQFRAGGHSQLADEVAGKSSVIPNGINLPGGEPSTGRKIIFVGRLIRDKGVADLIEAMRQLPGQELLIVGHGPDRPRLEALAAGLPVTFVGQVKPGEVFDYIRQARVLALPSHLGDGFPNVVLEAMALGVPVVATGIAGIPDLVHHQETGYLFEVGNVPQLAQYLKEILEDDILWQRLSNRSSEVAQCYSWSEVVPQIEGLLDKVVLK